MVPPQIFLPFLSHIFRCRDIHLVGTWAEQVPNESSLIGMNQLELMMTLHFIFVPILSIVALYYFLKISKEEAKKARG